MLTLGEVWPEWKPSVKAQIQERKRVQGEGLCPKTGKIRWRTFGEALKTKASLYRKSPDCLLRIYRCKNGCGDYHVGRL